MTAHRVSGLPALPTLVRFPLAAALPFLAVPPASRALPLAVVVLAMVWSAEADARLVVGAGLVAAAVAVEEWWLIETCFELDPCRRGALWGRPGRTARP